MNLAAMLSNGFILLIPIFVWNALFWTKLPSFYQKEQFDTDIPLIVTVGETIFRVIAFTYPLFIRISFETSANKAGFIIYAAGMVLYFGSWIIQIYAPNCKWSRTVYSRTAPAYTILFWLCGIALFANSYKFAIYYSPWHYISIAIVFTSFHFAHVLYAFFNYSANHQ